MDHKSDGEIIKGIGGKTGAAMWKEVDDLIVRWARRNPRAANTNMLHNQDIRDGLKDKKFAKSGSMGDGRLMLSIHPELMSYIETFYPKLFESKANVRRFAKTYKMFAVGERI